MDRSSLERLQHGFDSGCNSRVWAGRGEKESCAHRWIFFTPTRPLAQEENARTTSRTADRGHGVSTSQTPAIHPRPERNSGEPTERRAPGHHRRERDSSAREKHTLSPPSHETGKPGNRRRKTSPSRPNSRFPRPRAESKSRASHRGRGNQLPIGQPTQGMLRF